MRIIQSSLRLQKPHFHVTGFLEVCFLMNVNHRSRRYHFLKIDIRKVVKLIWTRLLCGSGGRLSVVPHLRRGRSGRAQQVCLDDGDDVCHHDKICVGDLLDCFNL